MGSSVHTILIEAQNILEKNGVSENHKRELLALLGILIEAVKKHEFAAEELEETSRSLATSLVSNQALLALLKQQTAELDALRKLSLNLTSSLDMPTVLDAIAHEAIRLVEYSHVVHIFLYRNGTLEFGAALQADGNARVFSVPRKDGLTYTVVKEAHTIIVEDMRAHPLYAGTPKEWTGSIIGIPLKMGETVLGVMNLSRTKVGGFSEAEMRLLNMLAEQASVAISNASLHQMISAKAYSDTVTGLPNRRALDERLERELVNARRTEQSFGLVMMDLDGFKRVNDTYGHSVGDQVLRVFFSYMAQGIRASDFLARYGGDELTLIISNTNLQSALLVTEKIQDRLHKFYFNAPDGQKIRLGLSGGVAIYPLHGRSGADLLRAADGALYHAKRHQRGTFVVAKPGTGPLDQLNLPKI